MKQNIRYLHVDIAISIYEFNGLIGVAQGIFLLQDAACCQVESLLPNVELLVKEVPQNTQSNAGHSVVRFLQLQLTTPHTLIWRHRSGANGESSFLLVNFHSIPRCYADTRGEKSTAALMSCDSLSSNKDRQCTLRVQ